jgi:hypothetical protein
MVCATIAVPCWAGWLGRLASITRAISDGVVSHLSYPTKHLVLHWSLVTRVQVADSLCATSIAHSRFPPAQSSS